MNIFKRLFYSPQITIVNKVQYVIHVVLSENRDDVIMSVNDKTSSFFNTSKVFYFNKNNNCQKISIGPNESSIFNVNGDCFVTISIEYENENELKETLEYEEFKNYWIVLEGFKVKKYGKLIIDKRYGNLSTVRKTNEFV